MPRKARPVDVEFVFTTVSTQRVYGMSPPVPRVVLTPRSSEALLRTGVEAEELRVRDLDSFWEPNIDPKVQRLRHEDYSSRRRELMNEVRMARSHASREMNATSKPRTSTTSAKPAKGGKGQPSSIQDDQQVAVSALVEQEETRLKKIQLKKKLEVEQMLAFEMRQLELQEEVQAKLKAEEEKAQRIKEQVERRRKEQVEAQRLKDLQRQAQLEFDEQRRRRIAEEAFRKEKELADKRKEEEHQRQREARRKQAEREEKARAQREHTEQLLKRKEQELLRRKQQAEEKEAQRLEKLNRQKRERARMQEEKARRAQQRIEMNRRLLEESDRRRAEEIELKEQLAQERSMRLEEKREEELRRQNLELQMQEERRQMLLEEAKREEEQRAKNLLSKQEAMEETIQMVQSSKERSLAIQREQQRLRIEAKLRNAERTKRKKDYERAKVQQKLEEDAARIEDMLKKKEQIKQARKAAAINAKVKRDMIAQAMEKIRLHKKWDAAGKLLEDIQHEGGSKRKGGSKKKKAKKSSSKSKHSNSMPALTTPYEQEKAAEAVAYRTAKKIESHNNRGNTKTVPYISPYEAAIEQQKRDRAKQAAANAQKASVVPAFADASEYDGSITF